MNFTRSETQKYLDKLNKVLADFAKKEGINIKTGNSKYGIDITTKITITKDVETEDGIVANTKEARNFKENGYKHGLPQEALFEEIRKKDGSTFRIMGYNTRAHKMPVQYEMHGGNYKCSVIHMKNMLKDSNSQYGV